MYTASGSCVSFYPSCSLVCVLKTENFLTMEALRALPIHSLHSIPTKLAKTQSKGPFFLNFRAIPSWSFSSPHQQNGSKSKLYTATPSSVSTEPTDPPQELETQIQNVKFDWYSQWYPILPVCDLDKRKPHGKKVMGIDLVVWWDRNESAWKVFDDTCPHRLAPLSEGRIDQWGRLQCVYHGWCFNGSGDCKFIPQAPPDGPPFHTFKKACVAAYPSTVQNDIVWFWPNTDPKYKDILKEQRPPYIPEIDDPSFTKLIGNRDFPYGYDVLIDNLMDPAHVAYAHYGIARVSKPKIKADREGGRPLELSLQKLDINGFISRQEVGHSVFGFISREEVGHGVFIPPCVYHFSFSHPQDQDNGAASSAGTKRKPPAGKRISLVLICVPVSPGTSRLIWVFPRNFGTWIDKIVPRWMFHVVQNLILDSDLYLLHVEERKIMDIGPENWEKGCFTPTKSDAQVIGFRKWLIKYSNGQVDWRGKFNGAAPPTPPREQLMDRYWSHVVNCRSCSAAYKSLNVLEVVLKLVSITIIGIVAATKQSMTSVAVRSTAVSVAVLCYAASRWLAHFIYKNFHFHDYDHAFR